MLGAEAVSLLRQLRQHKEKMHKVSLCREPGNTQIMAEKIRLIVLVATVLEDLYLQHFMNLYKSWESLNGSTQVHLYMHLSQTLTPLPLILRFKCTALLSCQTFIESIVMSGCKAEVHLST